MEDRTRLKNMAEAIIQLKRSNDTLRSYQSQFPFQSAELSDVTETARWNLRNDVFLRLSLRESQESIAELSDELFQAMELKLFRCGDHVLNLGSPGQKMFIIRSGVLRIHIHDVEIATQGRGEICGQIAFFNQDLSRTASATVFGGEAQLWQLDRATFEQIIGRTRVRQSGK